MSKQCCFSFFPPSFVSVKLQNSANLFPDDESPLSLEDCKKQILKNLQILERHGYVTKKDGFQAMITSLGRDIVNQKLYRTRRRREVFRLKATMQSLEKKRKFYEDQVRISIENISVSSPLT